MKYSRASPIIHYQTLFGVVLSFMQTTLSFLKQTIAKRYLKKVTLNARFTVPNNESHCKAKTYLLRQKISNHILS